MRKLVFIDDDPLLLDSDPALLRVGRRRRFDHDEEPESRSYIDRLDVLEKAWRREDRGARGRHRADRSGAVHR